MNFNLFPILVALCWMSVGIYAQSTTTMAPTSNTTANNGSVTAHSYTTTGNAITGSSNGSVTTPHSYTGNATTGSSNGSVTTPHAYTGNATTGSSNGSVTTPHAYTGNATTGSSNGSVTTPHAYTGNATTGSTNGSVTTPHAYTGNATTGSNNTTAGNATTGPSNTTAGNATSATNTASPPTTTAPPIEPNTTVVALLANINRGQCRKTKLCAAQPDDCDPELAGSCFFLGVKRSSGQNMDFELSGESDGYLGGTLKPTVGNETAYLCVKSKNKVIFIGARLVNGKFIIETLRVNNVKAKMNGRKIQCSFSATVPNSTARASDTTFAVSVISGTYNETSGTLGDPDTQLRTDPVDLANPTADTNNTLTNTTAVPATTAGTVPLPSISNALLIVLGVLSLAWL